MENEHWVKTELSLSQKRELQTENNCDCPLRLLLRLLLFSPPVTSTRHSAEPQESSSAFSASSNCEREDTSGFQTRCFEKEKGLAPTLRVIIVVGHDYLLQDNEELNYRSERSFLRNIKRLPVRSEELLRCNHFFPPPRGRAGALACTKQQRFVPTRTISICSHTKRLLSTLGTSSTICINTRWLPLEEDTEQRRPRALLRCVWRRRKENGASFGEQEECGEGGVEGSAASCFLCLTRLRAEQEKASLLKDASFLFSSPQRSQLGKGSTEGFTNPNIAEK